MKILNIFDVRAFSGCKHFARKQLTTTPRTPPNFLRNHVIYAYLRHNHASAQCWS